MKIAKYFFTTLCFSFLLISGTQLIYGQKSRVSAKGFVEQIVVEDTPTRYEYVLASDNGKRYRLSASHSLVEYANRRVTVAGILDADGLNISDEIKTVEAMQSVSPPAPTFGSRKVLTLLINFTNFQAQPTTVQQARSSIFTSAISANSYFKEASLYRYNLTGIERADGDVVGWLTLPFTNASCDVNRIMTEWTQGADALARQNGYEPNNYNSVLYVFPTTCIPSAIGTRGSVGDTTRVQRAWFASGDMNSVKAITHEIGHNLGLDHANAFVCSGTNIPDSCQNIVYGDPFDVMGGSSSFFFNNYYRLSLGWLTGKTQIVTASGEYNLLAPSITAKGNQILQILLRDPNGETALYSYYLEFRRPYSFDNLFGDNRSLPIYNGVSIRYAFREPLGFETYLIDTTPNTSNRNDAPLTVGNTFTDTENGVTITTLSTNPMRGARVRIELSQP